MEFTGERFIPEMDIDSEISVFHRQRYESVSNLCKGKIVLDAACGEGYGTDMLSKVAAYVTGIDISEEAVQNAKIKYQGNNIRFFCASVERLPIEDHSIDVVISFETIEHVSKEIQGAFLLEIRRVLKPDGILIMSSPDKKRYSDIPNFKNEFHIHELYFDQFNKLLAGYFDEIDYYYQGMFCNSYLYPFKKDITECIQNLNIGTIEESRAEYIIAVCGMQKNEDISSIVYDRFNRYYKMKDEILQLKSRLGEPGKIIEQKENYICEQREYIQEIERQNREKQGIIEQKENYIIEQRSIVEHLEQDIMLKRKIIQRLEERLSKIDNILNKKVIGKLIQLITGIGA